ncbi:tetratricopeptide repeat protein [Haloferula sp.]|uniref:tetratricopeptide repeat protein n=1 Tax=Haloferula sp. TaxID=2497595 RepID=UPI00329FFC39
MIVGLLIALGMAAWVVKEGIQEGAYLSAGNALIAAEDTAALQEVMEIHAGTPSAASAAVLLSDSQWEQGQQDDAIATLNAEIAAHPDHPATSAAYARLAARLDSQGKTDEAKAAYQNVLDRPQAAYYAPYALISLGQIAKSEGEIDKAKDYFRQASEGYPGNPLADSASKALQFIEFEMPEQIDPPEPEPAPAAAESGVNNTEFNPAALSGAQANPLFPGTDATPAAPAVPSIPEMETAPPVAPPVETPEEEKESSPESDK